MMRRAKIFVILFIIVLFLPLLQKRFKFVKNIALAGVETKIKRPVFSWENWFNCEYQEKFESRFNKRIGFKSYLIKIENQLNFSFFREISAKTKEKIILGKENWLYENSYIKSYNQNRHKSMKEIEKSVIKIKELQDLFIKYGKAFLVVISTNKALTYPEYLPDHLIDKKALLLKSDYQKTVRLFDKYGVFYVDGQKILKKIKKQTAYPVYTKGGTHWNYYGAFFVIQEMLNRLEKQLNKNLVDLELTGIDLTTKTRGTDNDLGELINIWSTKKIRTKTPYPEVKNKLRADIFKPNFLFVGSSFVFTITELMDKYQIYKTRETFYYYKRIFSYPDNNAVKIDKNNFNLKNFIMKNDVMIMEINETVLPIYWHEFIDDVFTVLD